MPPSSKAAPAGASTASSSSSSLQSQLAAYGKDTNRAAKNTVGLGKNKVNARVEAIARIQAAQLQSAQQVRGKDTYEEKNDGATIQKLFTIQSFLRKQHLEVGKSWASVDDIKEGTGINLLDHANLERTLRDPDSDHYRSRMNRETHQLQYAFKPPHDIQNKEQLLNLVERIYRTKGYRGEPIEQTLDQCYRGVEKDIKNLGAKNKIIVVETKERGKLKRMVFYTNNTHYFKVSDDMKQVWKEGSSKSKGERNAYLKKHGVPNIRTFKTGRLYEQTDMEKKALEKKKQSKVKQLNAKTMSNAHLGVDSDLLSSKYTYKQ